MISPLEGRYKNSNSAEYAASEKILGEDALIQYYLLIEKEYLIAISGLKDENIIKSIKEITISIGEVEKEELKTKHNIKAIVNIFKSKISEIDNTLAKYAHLGLTSSDVAETAYSLRLKDFVQSIILPSTKELLEAINTFIILHNEVVKVSRTHGQIAVPITAGFEFSKYSSRIFSSYITIVDLVYKLTGKLSGAVGSYTGTSIVVENPIDLEIKLLKKLGLKRGIYATQIMNPEPTLRIMLELNILFTSIANFADDLRNLQRTEIGEIKELYDNNSQVGSSTMPHKKNPWNSEHVKSLWKQFSPNCITWFQDAISDHQRDLTGSASGRFQTEYLFGLFLAIKRMTSIVNSLALDKYSINNNIDRFSESINSEEVYIRLTLEGKDGHEIVRKAILEGIPLDTLTETEICNIREKVKWAHHRAFSVVNQISEYFNG